VTPEQVALVPQCSECKRIWLSEDKERWRAYLDCDDEVWLFCPECAGREFDS
jgi:hypothetical protein